MNAFVLTRIIFGHPVVLYVTQLACQLEHSESDHIGKARLKFLRKALMISGLGAEACTNFMGFVKDKFCIFKYSGCTTANFNELSRVIT